LFLQAPLPFSKHRCLQIVLLWASFQLELRTQNSQLSFCQLSSTARLLLRTLDSMATPCSVKAMGGYLKPILSALEVTNCDLQFSSYFFVNSNMKSSGNLSMLRRTARDQPCSMVAPIYHCRCSASWTLSRIVRS